MSNQPKPEEVQITLFKYKEFRQLFVHRHETTGFLQWQALLSFEARIARMLGALVNLVA